MCRGGGVSANFESVYSVYRCQPVAAIIAEAETRHPVGLRTRPKLTHARLCRRSASGYCRSLLPSPSYSQIFKKLVVRFISANCIVSAREYYDHNSIKSNVQSTKVEFIQIPRLCRWSTYFIVSTSKNSVLIIQTDFIFPSKCSV